MRLLVLDNYDSFTYNLVHLVEKVSDVSIDVFKNDQISLQQIGAYDKILLSPGPGLPTEAGIMPELIKTYAHTKSILGICLGLQAIGQAFGARLKNPDRVYHGLALPVKVTGNDPLFNNCPPDFKAGRYHSWIVDSEGLPDELLVTAVDDENLIMGLKHNTLDVRGVQFHPESILSEYGEQMLTNWINLKH
ncbi:MAG: aminodeoxychorismate/anthranilate synthase component II [Bacteroidota bacterium]